MTLSQQQVQQFRSQGYLVVADFFSPREVDAMRSEVERLKSSGRLRNVATEGDGQTQSTKAANLQLCPMYKDSTLFRALPFAPQVMQAIPQLIGDPVVLHLDQVFLKPAGHGMGTNWHQDNAYFKISDPLQGTAMWIAVHDATLANGTMRIIPGMFRESLPHSRDPFSDHHIRCYPPEDKAVACEVKAGSVVFFCYGTPHCTGSNTTDKDRAGVAYHFLREEMIKGSGSEGSFADDRDYRPYLAGPKATGGLKEYGVKVAGTWEAEVEKTFVQTVSV